ncbi:2-C-methyl-D-erythritol 4-phosphate cytidylyltransferase [Actinokineospora globicatena]|uniref:2-C-methyl-D-erythritol 4-phosphate cytidylyltransferase n=1 Tax=Actinokineospora globicatena TaxID=103729 RepID=UPI0020A28C9A|nr:2-C-methyl-D-erythritol 4-phosphate cytidylyltransferase [Actinokineospora globicatena]MCP2300882.1 2-C-methyl-D-erythritol 4-phosphate cytidylyltransferase [Actinokineospora globicatena]GLW77492.1 2-C-methyl-D-erythritol 4-phosphate cytidylyltransferase [Actinokineospora globicatena]GLW84326.1 2-C-methyl-D-erythritol 4-phosphate cytidylyltransferase [Actinokineospora globicatena]
MTPPPDSSDPTALPEQARAVAIVPAAGRGERLGFGVPKALVPVRGTALLTHAVRGLLNAGCVRHVVVAAPPSEVESTAALLRTEGLAADVVPGGADRTESVRLALRHATKVIPDARVVLVHDAARSFTPAEVIRAVVAAVAAGAPAVVPVLPMADTVKQVDFGGTVLATPDRAALRVVQTPQGFDLDTLTRAYAEAGDSATDDAGLVEKIGIPVATVPGHAYAMKITTPFDLAIAEFILSREEAQ